MIIPQQVNRCFFQVKVGQNPKAGGQKYAFHIPKGQGYRGEKSFWKKSYHQNFGMKCVQ